MYLRLLATFLIMFAGLWIPMFFTGLSTAQQGMLVELPSLLFILVMILSHFFKQGRIGFAALLMLVAYNIIQQRLQTPLAVGSTLFEFYFLVLLLPINLVLLLRLPECSLFSMKALPYHFLFGLQALLFYWFIQPQQFPLITDFLLMLEPWLTVFIGTTVVPTILLVLLVCAVLTVVILMLCRDVTSDQALLSALLACVLTIIEFDTQWISASMFLLSAILLLFSILKRSHEQAFIDDLTRIPGRRALNSEIAELSGKYSIAMVDIDNFKLFNDTYGHDSGDMVLKMVASQLATVKGRGKVYRYGGEEFTILFKGKSAAECVDHLEAVRLLIADYPFKIRQLIERRDALEEDALHTSKDSVEVIEKVTQVTVSIGVAQNCGTITAKEVIKAADTLLYKAKASGRNQVCS